MKPKVKSPAREDLKTLVEKIGGESVLNSILHDFYVRMSQDVMIGFFFSGKNLAHISLQQGNFILNAAGLRDSFEGKGPSSAHTSLPPILSGHFDRRLVILKETLDAHHLPAELSESWIRFEESFRKLVVA